MLPYHHLELVARPNHPTPRPAAGRPRTRQPARRACADGARSVSRHRDRRQDRDVPHANRRLVSASSGAPSPSSARDATPASVRRMLGVLRAGGALAVAAEGTRTRSGRLEAINPVLARFAARADVPIPARWHRRLVRSHAARCATGRDLSRSRAHRTALSARARHRRRPRPPRRIRAEIAQSPADRDAAAGLSPSQAYLEARPLLAEPGAGWHARLNTMRDTLLRHPCELVAAASLLVAVIAIGPILILSGSPLRRRRHPPARAAAPGRGECARADARQRSGDRPGDPGHRRGHPRECPRALAFSGIAEPAPQPPARTAPVHHAVTEGEVLWQIAEQYNLRPETVLWANDIQRSRPVTDWPGPAHPAPPTASCTPSAVAIAWPTWPTATASTCRRSSTPIILTMWTRFRRASTFFSRAGGRSVPPSPPTRPKPPKLSRQRRSTVSPCRFPTTSTRCSGLAGLACGTSTDLYKTPAQAARTLHQVPGGVQLERVSGAVRGRIQVRDPGDGRTRQAMTGWVDAVDLDVGSLRHHPRAAPGVSGRHGHGHLPRLRTPIGRSWMAARTRRPIAARRRWAWRSMPSASRSRRGNCAPRRSTRNTCTATASAR